MTAEQTIRAAERAYDDHIRRHAGQLRDYVEHHGDQLIRHGIQPGGFALPLRPALVSESHLTQLAADTTTFLTALLKVFFDGFGGDVHRIAGLLQLEPVVVQTLEQFFTPERSAGQLFGRPDGFLVDGRIVYIEQNVTSGPGGLPAIDALTRFFAGASPLADLHDGLRARGLAPMDAYVRLFRSPAYAGTIGYLDAVMPDLSLWDDDGLRFLDTLADRGVHLVNLTNRELTLRSDGLYTDDRRIDVIYRGVAAVGLWHRTDELRPVYEACRRGLATMTSTPYEMILFDKQLLAYLSDPAKAPPLSQAERATLARILPWTRLLRDDHTRYGERRVHTPAFCLDHKDKLVLKRGNGYASDGVVIGVDTDERVWQTAVQDGLDQGNWIVQELVEPQRGSLPYLIDGAVQWVEATAMACPYVVRGAICGIAGRTSVPNGSRTLVGAGAPGSTAGIRTTFRIG